MRLRSRIKAEIKARNLYQLKLNQLRKEEGMNIEILIRYSAENERQIDMLESLIK